MAILLPFKDGIDKNADPLGRKSTSGCGVTALILLLVVQAEKIVIMRKDNMILNECFLISNPFNKERDPHSISQPLCPFLILCSVSDSTPDSQAFHKKKSLPG